MVSYDPCLVGEFHNVSLEKVIIGVPDDIAATPEAGIEVMKEIYENSYNEFNSENDLELPMYIVSNDLLLQVAENKSSTLSKSNIKDKIDDLAETSLIDAFEKEALYRMMDNMDDIAVLQEIKADLVGRNYSYESGQGVISRGAICLAISSTEYWASSLHNAGQISTRTPAHIDVGAFLVGAAVTAIAQDDLGWEDVPNIIAGGVITGVVASSGVAGRIGRWLFGK